MEQSYKHATHASFKRKLQWRDESFYEAEIQLEFDDFTHSTSSKLASLVVNDVELV